MQPIVIKCGGSVFEDLPSSFYKEIVQLQNGGEWQPIVVHGGGPLISKLLKVQHIPVQFVDGLRVTTEEVLDVVEMVLSGSMNKTIVRKLMQAGGQAIGLSGVDGQLILAEQVDNDRLGYVGQVKHINKDLLDSFIGEQAIPVISPIGIDESGQRYNINADIAAAAVARALGAHLCMISDIPGIYKIEDGQRHVYKSISKKQVEELIEQGTISGGMIPKVQAALDALKNGVPSTVILNGLEEGQLLDYCSGRSPGTKIVSDENFVEEGVRHV